MDNIGLKKRIIEISYKDKLSHLSSCLTSVDIIKHIYDTKKDNEPFILSAGHAGLALYVVLEEKFKKYGLSAEELLTHCGIHPTRNDWSTANNYIDCSTGSLGHGLPIAVGMALADRTRDVYCLISDGEIFEGSIIEGLRIAKEQELKNLKVYCNANGFSAYRKVPLFTVYNEIGKYNVEIVATTTADYDAITGIDGHYHVLTEEEYERTIKALDKYENIS